MFDFDSRFPIPYYSFISLREINIDKNINNSDFRPYQGRLLVIIVLHMFFKHSALNVNLIFSPLFSIFVVIPDIPSLAAQT